MPLNLLTTTGPSTSVNKLPPWQHFIQHINQSVVLTVDRLLWPPCLADADIIFLPRGFFFFYLSFFSLPNLSGRRLDVYHTCTHGVALARI